jgi:hypothetical protein
MERMFDPERKYVIDILLNYISNAYLDANIYFI